MAMLCLSHVSPSLSELRPTTQPIRRYRRGNLCSFVETSSSKPPPIKVNQADHQAHYQGEISRFQSESRRIKVKTQMPERSPIVNQAQTSIQT
jgi:hypothetical protein